MPRYQYECEACGQSFEQRQNFSDDPLTDCPLCSTAGSVQRIITSVGVVFKGSGFYINDSKKGAKGKKKESATSAKKEESSANKETSKESSATKKEPSEKSTKTETKASE
jgi:putative FmdB family regulatory protein